MQKIITKLYHNGYNNTNKMRKSIIYSIKIAMMCFIFPKSQFISHFKYVTAFMYIIYICICILVGWLECRFWIQRKTVRTPQQYVASLSKTLYPHCFSRLSCEMSTRLGQPREGCSVL